MNNTPKKLPEDAWEKGELGRSEEFVRKASAERAQAVDEGLGLQMISLRLPKDLVNELKALARDEGLGYQPYVRQLLCNHVRNKNKRTGTDD